MIKEPRTASLEMEADEFREAGHALVDDIADFLDTLSQRPVLPDESPKDIRAIVGSDPLPTQGAKAGDLLAETAQLLFDHSLLNGHPRFLAYITSSAAPLGALADLLASAINPNLGGWMLSPIATEIEAQTIRWIAELLGYPTDCGGLLVSGGNVANMVGLWVARQSRTTWDVRTAGLTAQNAERLMVYTSGETHTWIEKASNLSGLGTDAVRWIQTDENQRMNLAALEQQIEQDRKDGLRPFMVIGTAGSTSTGAIDPLPEIARLCREQDLWFHVDGAYGAPAAALPDAPADLKALKEADSIAIDPHKWLYAPLEAGCVLVRDSMLMRDTFSYHPPYYPDEDETQEIPPLFYHEYGPQNSRGFRALKVWLGLRQAGREGLLQMIADDIELAALLYSRVEAHPSLEAFTLGLSITTFRYRPPDLHEAAGDLENYLNMLNRQILDKLQRSGNAYPSNAVVRDSYLLRSCIVNFRTQRSDIEALPELVAELGEELDRKLRPEALIAR